MKNNEKGITLVELLASLALLSMVLLLANSIHIFSVKQSNAQKTEIQKQTDYRLAMNILTKEIRKADPTKVEAKNNILTIDGINYYLEGTSLKKGDQVLVSNIETFTPAQSGDKITIKIGTNSTTIYLRK
ncbi:prepilin-type N-terminal cleavage/methylation domain-containing protein [Bacillus sp. FJAT-29814]|uniref:prepilin-type N-terminal cleavage/methylation domain-containing protein n=1 Tax=Bacillus sp. FJAT-29814 TaxID=1729688 RepID=UPI000832E3D2|nr:prepilin-type N-terminal cleavage/methylation domain-containing protein [Bacillus sp. FJAT-29814]